MVCFDFLNVVFNVFVYYGLFTILSSRSSDGGIFKPQAARFERVMVPLTKLSHICLLCFTFVQLCYLQLFNSLYLFIFQMEVLNTHLFLTSKPVIYLVNLSTKDYIRRKNKWLVDILVQDLSGCCCKVVKASGAEVIGLNAERTM